MVVSVSIVSECQYNNVSNVGNKVCTNRFYYNNDNTSIIQIIERHYAQIFLISLGKAPRKGPRKSVHNSSCKRGTWLFESFARGDTANFIIKLVVKVLVKLVAKLVFLVAKTIVIFVIFVIFVKLIVKPLV